MSYLPYFFEYLRLKIANYAKKCELCNVFSLFYNAYQVFDAQLCRSIFINTNLLKRAAMKGNKELLTVLNSLMADEYRFEQIGLDNYLVSQTESSTS